MSHSYDMSGAILTTKQLYFETNNQQTIEIKGILSDAKLYVQVGSIQVLTPQNESAVLGQVSITRNGTDKAYLDEELFTPNPAGSHIPRGVVDSSQGSPNVAVTDDLHISISQNVPQDGATFILLPRHPVNVTIAAPGYKDWHWHRDMSKEPVRNKTYSLGTVPALLTPAHQ